MSIYSKRRGGRSVAAVAAAMLVASVLAVVAGSPVQAANTSFEVRVDHDNDAATAMVREFAGQDRYDTALRLAKNFATSKGGLGSVTSAFVSSGETLVDSISVAGLAGYTDAPILLTPTGSLHGGVADFIEDYGVSTVYVLGGSAAVSDATVTAIEGLSSEPTVTRIAGADRYATAAATASMIDAESSWCGTDAVSAVLINGATDMLAYGVAVQSMAYRLQLPVLMTASDMLPDATAEFISDNDVEHVQIVGGTSAVSAGVASALTTLGVDTVARTDGDSAAAVSIALAQSAGNGCGDDLGLVSTDRVALVRGNPDGVVAAPVLASSLAGGYLVPPLIVGDSLPASVREYLAATPEAIGTTKLNLGIVAIGGTAAVSEATMDAALAAGASSGALTVQIGAAVDTTGDGVESASDPVRPQNNDPDASPAETPMFTLYFSDDVEFGDADQLAALLGEIRDIIEVNGVPAVMAAPADRTRPAVTVLAIAPANADGTAETLGLPPAHQRLPPQLSQLLDAAWLVGMFVQHDVAVRADGNEIFDHGAVSSWVPAGAPVATDANWQHEPSDPPAPTSQRLRREVRQSSSGCHTSGMSEPVEPPDDGTTVVIAPDVNPAGSYANGFGVWGTPIDFTVDFLVGPLAPEDSSQIVVARVRMSPQTVAGLATALESALEEHIRAQDLAGVNPGENEDPS